MELFEILPWVSWWPCIGVDPYYLTYKAEMMGYHSQIILSGRRINDDMGRYVSEQWVKRLIEADKSVKGAHVTVLGFAFKENCPDTRNTRVIDIINELREYGIKPLICDPCADSDEVERLYGIHLTDIEEVSQTDAIIVAVAHKRFFDIKLEEFGSMYRDGIRTMIDVKGIYDKKQFVDAGYNYWRL